MARQLAHRGVPPCPLPTAPLPIRPPSWSNPEKAASGISRTPSECRTGHAGGGNLALGYEHYGTRVAGPQVGAIAVMGRRGGGHVGVVSGIDANGNPIIVSGNHNHTVAESVYPRSRIAAYVLPGG